jgi:predicted GNAT superfamily acetyltransferase
MTMATAARTEPHAAGTVVIRSLERLDEQTAAGELYRRVFDYSPDGSSVSPRLLRSLIDNGGSALGAFDRSDRLIGFAYGFSAVDTSAVDGSAPFHYSQATVIDRAAQGLGIGRALKLEQARVARSTGAATMRWSYDPYLVANAHFNLSSLGASGRWFHPDYFGEPHTDRLVVEWLLDPAARQSHLERAAVALASVAEDIRSTAATGSAGAMRWIAFDLDESRAAAAPGARAALRDTIVSATSDGLVALACDTVESCESGRPGTRAAYLFGRL